MKNFLKSTSSLILVIVFLSACLLSLILIFTASWLYTFNVFTKEKAVAELTISKVQEDNLGPYVNVTVTPIETDQDALTTLFVGNDNPNPIKLESKQYKIYGDTVYIGGPVLKFEDELILLNFDSAYKLNSIFGRYEQDIELENSRTPEMASSYQIGEPDDVYRSIARDIRRDNLKGKIYKFFFDSEPQLKPAGIFVDEEEEIRGTLVIRNDGFKWNLDEEE